MQENRVPGRCATWALTSQDELQRNPHRRWPPASPWRPISAASTDASWPWTAGPEGQIGSCKATIRQASRTGSAAMPSLRAFLNTDLGRKSGAPSRISWSRSFLIAGYGAPCA